MFRCRFCDSTSRTSQVSLLRLDADDLKLRDDGAHQGPNPETPQAYATQSNFGFSQDPQNKRDPKGFRVAYSCGDSGGLVNSEKVLPLEGSSPTWRVGLMVSHAPAIAATFEGGPWFSLEYDLATRLLTGS